MNDVNYLKQNGIDADKSIGELGEDMYKEMLELFLSEIADKVNKLRDCLVNNNMKDYSTYVHGIKGESAYLGFTELVRQALEHQNKSTEGDTNYISQNYATLVQEIQRVINVVCVFLGRVSA